MRAAQGWVLAKNVECVLLEYPKLVLEALADVALADADRLDDIEVLTTEHAERVCVEPVPMTRPAERTVKGDQLRRLNF